MSQGTILAAAITGIPELHHDRFGLGFFLALSE